MIKIGANMKPTMSVIIPNKNGLPSLPRAIERIW